MASGGSEDGYTLLSAVGEKRRTGPSAGRRRSLRGASPLAGLFRRVEEPAAAAVATAAPKALLRCRAYQSKQTAVAFVAV